MSGEKSGPLPKILTVGQVAERSGVAVSTIHFYESKGLIASWRTDGNQRRYLRSVLRQVSVIKVAQQLGIPLDSLLHDQLGRPHQLTDGRPLPVAG